MEDKGFDRRAFLKSAVAGSAAAATVSLPQAADAQKPAAVAPAGDGYTYFGPDEAAFVEALVDHMVPADELTASGTGLGLQYFYRSRLSRQLGKRRPLVYAGTVETRCRRVRAISFRLRRRLFIAPASRPRTVIA